MALMLLLGSSIVGKPKVLGVAAAAWQALYAVVGLLPRQQLQLQLIIIPGSTSTEEHTKAYLTLLSGNKWTQRATRKYGCWCDLVLQRVVWPVVRRK
jgi:hypothetical protein